MMNLPLLSPDLRYIGIQLIGFLAMGLGIGSYQAKKRTNILLFQMCASVLWSVQFILLGGITGAVLNIISIVRNLLYAQKDKYKWAGSVVVPICIISAFLLAGILTFDGLISLLPTAAMLLSSVALFISDEKKIRILSLFVSPLWLIYDAVMGSVAGTFAEAFTIVSIIIAIIRFSKRREEK